MSKHLSLAPDNCVIYCPLCLPCIYSFMHQIFIAWLHCGRSKFECNMAPGHWELRTEMGRHINCSVQFSKGRTEGGAWSGKDFEKRVLTGQWWGLKEMVCLQSSFSKVLFIKVYWSQLNCWMHYYYSAIKLDHKNLPGFPFGLISCDWIALNKFNKSGFWVES